MLLVLPIRCLLLLLVLPDPVSSFHANSNSNSGSIFHESSSASSSRSPHHRSSPTITSSSSSSSENNSSNDPTTTIAMESLSVGFLGCGTIASSIARGLAKASKDDNDDDDNTNTNSIGIRKMVVSKRSESKSTALVSDLSPSVDISVASSNQAIVDACDLIFLTVLPQQASEVLKSLEFDPDRHVLVSLVSTANLQDLAKDSKLDLSRVSKMICLPSIARHQGVALLCCGDTGTTNRNSSTTRAVLTDLFGAMGGVVCLDTEADLEACMVTTCTMGPLYGTMKRQRDWLLQTTKTLSRADATFLVVQQFAGALSDPHSSSSSSAVVPDNLLEALIDEQTQGGLNEQALRNYGTVLGGFEDLQKPVMDAILSRIRGETDGSLSSGGGGGTK